MLSATIKEEAGRWFVSFGCEVERHDPVATYPDAIVGVDLGVHHFAVLSTGELFENPKPISHYARRMARLNRELSRRQKGSKRRAKTKAKLARCHARVANVRRDTLHKLTTHLATAYGTVVIEDLAVKNMTACPKPKADPENPGHHLENGHTAKAGLNRSILDMAPGELRRQLTYKMGWHGGHLVVADRWFPSSKKCSSCKKTKATLSLATRTYRCEHCGLSSTGPQCSAQPCRLRQGAPRRREWPGDSKRTQRRCFVYQRHRCTLPEKPSWQEASRRLRATGEGRHRLFARGGGVSVRVTTAHSIATVGEHHVSESAMIRMWRPFPCSWCFSCSSQRLGRPGLPVSNLRNRRMRLDRRLGIGDALGGMVLLAIAGSLPELAVTISAAESGHLGLAAGNLIGGISHGNDGACRV